MTVFWRWPIEPVPTREFKCKCEFSFLRGTSESIPRLIPENCTTITPKDLANRFGFDCLTKKPRINFIRPGEKKAGQRTGLDSQSNAGLW